VEYIAIICMLLGAFGMLLSLFSAALTDDYSDEVVGIAVVSAAIFSGGAMLLIFGGAA
jgi:hypothetical protein